MDKNTFWSHEEPNMALTSPHSGLLREKMPDGLGRSPARVMPEEPNLDWATSTRDCRRL